MSQPSATRLHSLRVPLRVTVDRARWGIEDNDLLESAVRTLCVEVLREHPLIHSVRRDGDTR